MKALKVWLAVLMVSLMSFGASAAESDFTGLTGSVTFVNVIAAILAIGIVLMGVYVAILGVNKVISMVRGR